MSGFKGTSVVFSIANKTLREKVRILFSFLVFR